ncbi:MAG: long-chain fatty acid--CoA ligase [Bacteroidaceae bacterium]|nr:long-chain fatty acid--CoA ligase [Bacteroidaceae bacterium]
MENLHFSTLIHHQAQKYGDKVALKQKYNGLWMPISWNEFSDQVKRNAEALAYFGVKEQDTIGLFSTNKPECFYVDFGAYSNRAITVPFYATSSPAQLCPIIHETQLKIMFVGNQEQYDVLYSVIDQCPTIERIIVLDAEAVLHLSDGISMHYTNFIQLGHAHLYQRTITHRASSAQPDDIANILYTSGTTGLSKGVILTHQNYMEQLKNMQQVLPDLSDRDISINFLPLSHVFERTWCYLCFMTGIEVCINEHPTEIQETLKEIRPTIMCAIPRFWEKIYSGVLDKMAASSRTKRALLQHALTIGRLYNIDYWSANRQPPRWLQLFYSFYRRRVFSILKRRIGLDRGRMFPTGGAAISDEVSIFVHAVGLNLIIGYGLTESSAVVSCTLKRDYLVGSVGKVVPGVELKIGSNKEILIRGKSVTQGYYKNQSATVAAIDSEGWFHTGDAGYLKEGHLFLTERLKDLFKTSNGKYIAPQALETKLGIDPYIDQIAVIGDQRKFVSALIVPSFTSLEVYASTEKIAYNSMEELLANDAVQLLYTNRLQQLLTDFAAFEKIKRFKLLRVPFAIETGELTNTLKLKRRVIEEKYKNEIEEMYKEEPIF